MSGTVPAGGEMILVIYTECRKRGFRIIIMADNAVVILNIP